MPKKTASKSKVERKLDIVFETLLHIVKKVLDEDEVADLHAALSRINAEHKAVN